MVLPTLLSSDARDAEVGHPGETASSVSSLGWDIPPQTTAKPNFQSLVSATGGFPATTLDRYALYHIQRANQQYCLAVAVAGDYYRYYRRRPSADKAQGVVQQLQQQGKQAIATLDDVGYVVWIHESEPPQQAVPWLDGLSVC